MRGSFRIAAVAALAFALAAGADAEQKAKKAPSDAEIAAALEHAMTPGDGQKKLAFMVGTFDAKFRTWATPSSASGRGLRGHGGQLGARRALHPDDAGRQRRGPAVQRNRIRGIRQHDQEVHGDVHGLRQHGHGVVHGWIRCRPEPRRRSRRPSPTRSPASPLRSRCGSRSTPWGTTSRSSGARDWASTMFKMMEITYTKRAQ